MKTATLNELIRAIQCWLAWERKCASFRGARRLEAQKRTRRLQLRAKAIEMRYLRGQEPDTKYRDIK